MNAIDAMTQSPQRRNRRCSRTNATTQWTRVTRYSSSLLALLFSLSLLACTSDLFQLRQQAEQGDATAEFKLAARLWWGNGAEHNRGEALRWFHRAAEHGNADAQYQLGLMYESGNGGGVNLEEAARWYQKAAEQRHPEAQYRLGMLYLRGQGVPKSYPTALTWLKKAALQGEVKAQLKLGELYDEGQAVSQDYVQAYVWWNLAAGRGSPQGKALREYVALKMTPQQLEDAHKLIHLLQTDNAPDTSSPNPDKDDVQLASVVDVERFPSFHAAIAAIGAATTTLRISSPQSVTSSVTVPANITLCFIGQGQLSINAGVTIVHNGLLVSARPLSAIVAGAGSFVFGPTGRWSLPEPPAFGFTGLPAVGTAGRMVRLTDHGRGIYSDTGVLWANRLGGAILIADYIISGNGTAASPYVADWAQAIADAPSNAGVILISPGIYRTNSQILVNKTGLALIGMGSGIGEDGVEIQGSGAIGSTIKVAANGVTLANFSIGFSGTAPDFALDLDPTQEFLAERMIFSGGSIADVRARTSATYAEFRNCVFSSGAPIGLQIVANNNTNIKLINNEFTGPYTTAVDANAYGVLIFGNVFHGGVKDAIVFSGADGQQVIGNWFELSERSPGVNGRAVTLADSFPRVVMLGNRRASGTTDMLYLVGGAAQPTQVVNLDFEQGGLESRFPSLRVMDEAPNVPPAENRIYRDNIIIGRVNFDGEFALIREAYNIASVTRNAAGVYTVNFARRAVNSNYAVVASASVPQTAVDSFGSDSFRILTRDAAGNFVDASIVSAIVVGRLE